MIRRATARAVLLGLPAVLLATAYAWLAVDHETPWLLPTVVHEDGRRTLLGTVFYFRHFLREILILILYAAISSRALRAYGPGLDRVDGRGGSPAVAFLLAAALVVLAWLATLREWGSAVAFGDLLQGYTRDDRLEYGSHWRSHLLSTLAYLAAAAGLACALARTLARAEPAHRERWIGRTLLAIGALTLLFRPTWQPFVDARYLAHQAREAATHLLITLPLSFAPTLAPAGAPEAEVAATAGPWALPREVAVLLGLGALVLAFLGVATVLSGARSLRAEAPLSALVAAHAFEHSLDYVFVALLSSGLARARSAPSASSAGRAG